MSRSAKEVRNLRRRLGWTQQRLAMRLGVDVITVSRWERGVSSPSRHLRHALEALASPDAAATNEPAPDESHHERQQPPVSVHADIDELVRIVGVRRARAALRREALLRRAPTPVALPVDPDVRLRELEAALREQSDLISRARIG